MLPDDKLRIVIALSTGNCVAEANLTGRSLVRSRGVKALVVRGMPTECLSDGLLLHESIGAEDNRWRKCTGDSIGNEHGSASVEATHA